VKQKGYRRQVKKKTRDRGLSTVNQGAGKLSGHRPLLQSLLNRIQACGARQRGKPENKGGVASRLNLE